MKIGITEAGDGGIDVSWAKKLSAVDAAIIITKDLREPCQSALAENKDKCILHYTITGYGGTILEANVPEWEISMAKLFSFLGHTNFPINQVVVRVDPIIPTDKGLSLAETVLRTAAEYDIKRFRISLIDMYQHVRERFSQKKVPNPYGKDGFKPTLDMVKKTGYLAEKLLAAYPDIMLESCAEDIPNVEAMGCVSSRDLDILRISHGKLDNLGLQRHGCLCASCKTELLQQKRPCEHQCLYCYWKN